VFDQEGEPIKLDVYFYHNATLKSEDTINNLKTIIISKDDIIELYNTLGD